MAREEEKLDPNYFSTTPKSSWELFKWIFTEPIKLKIFNNNLSSKKSFIWFSRTFFWIFLFSFFLFLLFNIFLVLLDNYSFIIISDSNSYELYSFYEKVSFITQESIIDFFKILSLGLFYGFVGTILFDIRIAFILNFIFALVATIVAFRLFEILFVDFSYPIIIIKILIFTLSTLIFISLVNLIEKGWYIYPYYFFYSLFININLEKNQYLYFGYNFSPIFDMEEELAKDSFKRRTLAQDFIKFLFKFRPFQRDLAFYLLNVISASKMHQYKLAINHIKIAINYEENQPKENFTNTLQKLKNELGTYQTQHNIQFKIKSLDKIIKILKDLEQQMLIEKRGWSEYYLKAIRANLDEANARLQNYKLEAKNREPITPNIYEIGNPLSPNYQNKLFKGRTEVVDRLSNIIYTSPQMPLLLIQGQRRVGKTSLINYLEQLLGSGFKIVKLDMQSATNKEFGSLVKNINQELNSMLGIDETIETSDNIMQSWIAFEEYLTKHTKALNYKIIIAFDEYESFHEYIVQKYGKIILENMRSFIQSQNKVIFLFAGMLRISDLTSPNWDEYFPQAQRLKVDYLSKEESYELITHPVDDFNLVYSDEVAKEVYRWTMGHPQLLQTICSNIVTIANQINQKRVTFEMVAKAKDEVFEVNEMPMTIFWREFCRDEERELMEQILADKVIIRETREQRRAVARLIDYGFISKEFEIFVPLFEKWLIERRDLIKIP